MAMKKTAKKRATATKRTVTAGCYGCAATWAGAGAQGAAARHHDETSHQTWANVKMLVVYGKAQHASPLIGGTRRRRRSRATARVR